MSAGTYVLRGQTRNLGECLWCGGKVKPDEEGAFALVCPACIAEEEEEARRDSEEFCFQNETDADY